MRSSAPKRSRLPSTSRTSRALGSIATARAPSFSPIACRSSDGKACRVEPAGPLGPSTQMMPLALTRWPEANPEIGALFGAAVVVLRGELKSEAEGAG